MLSSIINRLKGIKLALKKSDISSTYLLGSKYKDSSHYKDGQKANLIQNSSIVKRHEIINFLLKKRQNPLYLEIGVRNPNDNFNLIRCDQKYGVDPGLEFGSNPVEFRITSDMFFEKLSNGDLLNTSIKFDIIFIDGLHQADQVMRDIKNSLNYLTDDGFVILHDCNPPTEFHASENYGFVLSPSMGAWNGTTWKAFVEIRKDKSINSCCIDTDWGIGVINKSVKLFPTSTVSNPFFEYHIFAEKRKESLGLISYKQFKNYFKH